MMNRKNVVSWDVSHSMEKIYRILMKLFILSEKVTTMKRFFFIIESTDLSDDEQEKRGELRCISFHEKGLSYYDNHIINIF